MESSPSLHWLQKLEILIRITGMLSLAAGLGAVIYWVYLQEKPPVVESVELLGTKVSFAQGIDSAQKTYSGPIASLSKWSDKVALAQADKKTTLDPGHLAELDSILKDFGVAQETLDARKTMIAAHVARAESAALETQRQSIQAEILSLEEKKRIINAELKKAAAEALSRSQSEVRKPKLVSPEAPTSSVSSSSSVTPSPTPSTTSNKADQTATVIPASPSAPMAASNSNESDFNRPSKKDWWSDSSDQPVRPFTPNIDPNFTAAPTATPAKGPVAAQEPLSEEEQARDLQAEEDYQRVQAQIRAYEEQYLGAKAYEEEMKKKKQEQKTKGFFNWLFGTKKPSEQTVYLEAFPSKETDPKKTKNETQYLEPFPSANPPRFRTRVEELGPPPEY